MRRPKISVIIPNKDDGYLLSRAVDRLNYDIDPKDVEIIIIDDGSSEPVSQNMFNRAKNVIIHDIKVQKGVGHAFDYGVKKAKADKVLLMGSDVIMGDSRWLEYACKNAEEYPTSFTCSVCVGLSEKEDIYDWSGKTRRYGANILFVVNKEDLPKKGDHQNNDAFADILQCKWIRKKKDDKSYEIPCVLGACYVVRKDWYMHIGGWGWIKSTNRLTLGGEKSTDGLTKEETKWLGHRMWGGLEPMIGLKTWFAGGSCRIDPQWETGHFFGRDDYVAKSRSKRMDMYYFNKLFIAHTLFGQREAEILNQHLLTGRNENIARTTIDRNWKAIETEKRYNESIKQEGYYILKDRVGTNTNCFK